MSDQIENPDEKVLVWEVWPSRDTDYDYEVFDDYREAIECANIVSEALIDDMEIGEEKTVTIKLVKEVTRKEFHDEYGWCSLTRKD